jgi:hypothetical protein
VTFSDLLDTYGCRDDDIEGYNSRLLRVQGIGSQLNAAALFEAFEEITWKQEYAYTDRMAVSRGW